MLSLYSQSIGFNPANGILRPELPQSARLPAGGLEFVDIIKQESADLDRLGRVWPTFG